MASLFLHLITSELRKMYLSSFLLPWGRFEWTDLNLVAVFWISLVAAKQLQYVQRLWPSISYLLMRLISRSGSAYRRSVALSSLIRLAIDIRYYVRFFRTLNKDRKVPKFFAHRRVHESAQHLTEETMQDENDFFTLLFGLSGSMRMLGERQEPSLKPNWIIMIVVEGVRVIC